MKICLHECTWLDVNHWNANIIYIIYPLFLVKVLQRVEQSNLEIRTYYYTGYYDYYTGLCRPDTHNTYTIRRYTAITIGRTATVGASETFQTSTYATFTNTMSRP